MIPFMRIPLSSERPPKAEGEDERSLLSVTLNAEGRKGALSRHRQPDPWSHKGQAAGDNLPSDAVEVVHRQPQNVERDA